MIDWFKALEGVHLFLYGMAIVTTVGVFIARVKNMSKESKFREYMEAGFFAIWVALAVRATIAEAQSIPSESMVPTFLIGDNLLVTKYNWGYHVPGLKGRIFDFGKPNRGDIVTFLPPVGPGISAVDRKNYVKRCVGIPGDIIEVKNKRVYVNDRLVDYPEAIGYLAGAPDEVINDPGLADLERGSGWHGPVKREGRNYWVLRRDRQVQVYGNVLGFPGQITAVRDGNPGAFIKFFRKGINKAENWLGPVEVNGRDAWVSVSRLNQFIVARRVPVFPDNFQPQLETDPVQIQAAIDAVLLPGLKINDKWYGRVEFGGQWWWLLVDGVQVQLARTFGKEGAPPPPADSVKMGVLMDVGNRTHYGPTKLDENRYWMMGDNRDNSKDSRYFGPAVYEDIRGNPVFRYFPFARLGSVN